MILKKFAGASSNLAGDNDEIGSESGSPKFKSDLLFVNYTQQEEIYQVPKLRTIHNTEDETVIRGSPAKRIPTTEYFSNETFKGHQAYETTKHPTSDSSDLLLKLNFAAKENVNPQVARTIPFQSNRTDLHSSITSNKLGLKVPESFISWQKNRGTEIQYYKPYNYRKPLQKSHLATVQCYTRQKSISTVQTPQGYPKQFVQKQQKDIQQRRVRHDHNLQAKQLAERKQLQERPSIGEVTNSVQQNSSFTQVKRSKTLASQQPYTSVQVHTRLYNVSQKRRQSQNTSKRVSKSRERDTISTNREEMKRQKISSSSITSTLKKVPSRAQTPDRVPILHVDVNLGFATERVSIYEGDTSDNLIQLLSKRICSEHLNILDMDKQTVNQFKTIFEQKIKGEMITSRQKSKMSL